MADIYNRYLPVSGKMKPNLLLHTAHQDTLSRGFSEVTAMIKVPKNITTLTASAG